MGMAENTRERGREQAGMTREGRRTMEKVLENTVRDTVSVDHGLGAAQSSVHDRVVGPFEDGRG